MGKLDHFAFLLGIVFFAAMASFAGLDNNGWFVTLSLMFFVVVYVALALFAPRGHVAPRKKSDA